jgi:HemY protein
MALVAIAVAIALLAQLNPGNVVFFVAPYRVDVSLNFFLVAAAVLFFIVYAVVRATRATLRLPIQVQAYRRERREIRAREGMLDALTALYEGRFVRAERRAQAALNSEQWSGIAALVAARAAHRMKEYERRDRWLAMSRKDKSLKTASLMSIAELAGDARQNETALRALEELKHDGGRHIEPMRLAVHLHQRAGHWPELLRVVRSLDKRDALHPMVVAKLKYYAISHQLQDLREDADALQNFWKALPAYEQLQPDIALAGMQAFHRNGMGGKASRIAEQVLENEWDTRLVDLYGDCFDDDGKLRQIEQAERWLIDHSSDAVLMMTLGRLCARRHLWGKAERYLVESLHLHPKPKAAFALAQVCEKLDRHEEAARYYKLASALALGVAVE